MPVGSLSFTRTRWDNRTLHKKMTDAAIRGVREAAEFNLEKASETVPLEEGDLKGNGRVVEGVQKDSSKEFRIVYDLPYAVKQHEAMLQHDGTGRRKWLELTLQENERETLERYAKGMKEELPGRG